MLSQATPQPLTYIYGRDARLGMAGHRFRGMASAEIGLGRSTKKSSRALVIHIESRMFLGFHVVSCMDASLW